MGAEHINPPLDPAADPARELIVFTQKSFKDCGNEVPPDAPLFTCIVECTSGRNTGANCESIGMLQALYKSLQPCRLTIFAGRGDDGSELRAMLTGERDIPLLQ